jgi:hypothetical protein
MSITQGSVAEWTIPLFAEDGTPLTLESMVIVSSAQDTSGNVLYENSLETNASGDVVAATNITIQDDDPDGGVIIESIPADETILFPVGQYVTLFTIELADGSFLYPIPPGIVEVVSPTPSSPAIRNMIHGMTRRDIRRTVARMLNDYYEGTDDSGGNTGQLTDNLHFARETGFFQGMQVLFSNPASPHYGRISTVVRSDGPTRTIYFEPPLSSSAIAGETVELYNFKGRGTTVSQYNGAINDAILIAQEQHYTIRQAMTLPTLFSRSSPYIDIPEEFVYFSGVQVEDSQGIIHKIRPQEMEVDRFSGNIRVRASSAVSRLHGRYPVILGSVAPRLLETDDDRTSIPAEWLFNEVKAQLLERMVASGMPIGAQDRLYLQERTEASGKRPMVVSRAMPNSIRLG